jgi:hypothetical protein
MFHVPDIQAFNTTKTLKISVLCRFVLPLKFLTSKLSRIGTQTLDWSESLIRPQQMSSTVNFNDKTGTITVVIDLNKVKEDSIVKDGKTIKIIRAAYLGHGFQTQQFEYKGKIFNLSGSCNLQQKKESTPKRLAF